MKRVPLPDTRMPVDVLRTKGMDPREAYHQGIFPSIHVSVKENVRKTETQHLWGGVLTLSSEREYGTRRKRTLHEAQGKLLSH